jgi:hypothetical protein
MMYERVSHCSGVQPIESATGHHSAHSVSGSVVVVVAGAVVVLSVVSPWLSVGLDVVVGCVGRVGASETTGEASVLSVISMAAIEVSPTRVIRVAAVMGFMDSGSFGWVVLDDTGVAGVEVGID